MMKKSIVQSERQRPRAVDLMKAFYTSHVASCEHGENCPQMVDLRKAIETEERPLLDNGSNFSRSLGLK